jgi:hypothetical protein
MARRLLNLVAAAALAAATANVYADEYREGVDDTPSAGAMAFDLVVVRPVALVGTILGTGLFILGIPLSLIQGEPPMDPAKKLVVEPAKYTFERPLGQME